MPDTTQGSTIDLGLSSKLGTLDMLFRVNGAPEYVFAAFNGFIDALKKWEGERNVKAK